MKYILNLKIVSGYFKRYLLQVLTALDMHLCEFIQSLFPLFRDFETKQLIQYIYINAKVECHLLMCILLELDDPVRNFP
jgi:hypothetical protein